MLSFVAVPLCTNAQLSPADSLKFKRKSANLLYQDNYIRNVDFSYVSPFGEIGAPDKYVLNTTVKTIYMVVVSEKFPVAFAVLPEITARVRQEESAGVRTPSYKLGGVFMFRLGLSEVNYRYAEAGFMHHSNGQDGPALNADGTLNTVTGNFSTNYITAAYRWGKYKPRSAWGSYSFNHKVGIDLHRLFKFEKAIKSDYGFTRLNYQFSLRRYTNSALTKRRGPDAFYDNITKEVWRWNADAGYATNAIKGYGAFALERRLNIESSFHYSFPFMGNSFLMGAIGYYGEDPYNIYYRNHYGYVRFGVSSGISKYLTGRR
ncbi:MAG: hypothetical protein EOP51_33910 [Sphingobacteriales bacterium]|nr:MAG: hypothetical protein EOP51_33910 [Sphingobacteriales bacterium]